MQFSIWGASKLHEILAQSAMESPEGELCLAFKCKRQLRDANIHRQAVNIFRKYYAGQSVDFSKEQFQLHEKVLEIAKELPIGNLSQFVYEIRIENPVLSKISMTIFHRTVLVLFILSTIHLPTCKENDNKYALDLGGQRIFNSEQVIFATTKCLASLLSTIQPMRHLMLSPLLADIFLSVSKIIAICKNAMDCFRNDISTKQFALVWYTVSQDIQPIIEMSSTIWPGLISAKRELVEILNTFP
jgi:hypothetical protein